MPDELLPVCNCEKAHRAGDVVFVHGLNGNAREYWCHEGKRENYWPAWLGEELPNVGVWSLGYENAAFKSRRVSFLGRSGYRGFAMPLWDRAKSVLLQLEVMGIGDRPIVFVAHSMGGLLVKELLSAASDNADQPAWGAILEQTRGVCFIATPHIGSDLAKWASYFKTLLGTNVSIEELRPHDPLLRQLNERYVNLVTKPGVSIKTLAFYETRPLVGNTLVVAEGDANPNVPHAGLYALSEDHVTICKPRSRSEAIQKKLAAFIRSDCFQLPDLRDEPIHQHDDPTPTGSGPPWPDGPAPIRAARKRGPLLAAIGAAAVAGVVPIVANYAFGPVKKQDKPSTNEATTTTKPPPEIPKALPIVMSDAVASSDLNKPTPPTDEATTTTKPSPDIPKPPPIVTSDAVASSDLNKPTPLALGAVVHGRVDPRSTTVRTHYWLCDLQPGSYKAVVDLELSDRANSNILAQLDWLSELGDDMGKLGFVNEVDVRARNVFRFQLNAPQKRIIRVSSTLAMTDYDLGLFAAAAPVTKPFFRRNPKVTPIELGQVLTSASLDNRSGRGGTDSAYWSLTLPAGDYRVHVELSSSTGGEINLNGAVLTLNADGRTTAKLGSIITVDSRSAKSFVLALAEPQFVILRVTGANVNATMKVDALGEK